MARILAPLLAVASTALGCSCEVTKTANLLGAPLSPDEVREARIQENTGKLRVGLALDRFVYAPLQSAVITISIENPTDEPLEVWDFESDFFYLRGASPCALQCGLNRTKSRRLDPHENIIRTLPVKWEAGFSGSTVPEKPGDYQLIYTYLGDSADFRVAPEEPKLLRAIIQGGMPPLVPGVKPGSDDLLEIYGTGLRHNCPNPRALVNGKPLGVIDVSDAGPVGVTDEARVLVPYGSARGAGVPVKLLCGERETNEITTGGRE
jgi:hypothetical protein